MTQNAEQPRQAPPLPKARTEKDWRHYLFWLIPVAAAAIAGWIVYHELIAKGPTVEIYFDNAEELEKGKSKVKFRGVDIGTVEGVDLTGDSRQVKVTISLERSAAGVARQGSLFWIVKPELGLNKITGVQTIMGGNYVTVQPGPGKQQTVFRGLPEAPATQMEVSGLRVMLLAEKLGSIKQHSPVLYHDMQVGEVHDSSLGPEGQTVRIFLNIDRKYAPLVRMNSRFWNAGQPNVSIGLGGIKMSAESVSTLLTGGIAFATPDGKEREAYEGAAFRLYEKPEPGWLKWYPAIKLPLVGGPH